jgi:hypothetical protein
VVYNAGADLEKKGLRQPDPSGLFTNIPLQLTGYDPFSLYGIPVVGESDVYVPIGSAGTPGQTIGVTMWSPDDQDIVSSSIDQTLGVNGLAGVWIPQNLGDAFTLFGANFSSPQSNLDNFSWWGAFFRALPQNITSRSLRQPGESYGSCVNGTVASLFGSETAANVEGALGVVSGFASALTTSPGELPVPNAVTITGNPVWRYLPSLVDQALPETVAAGTMSAATAETVGAAAAAVSSVAGPVFAVTGGVIGGIFAACR